MLVQLRQVEIAQPTNNNNKRKWYELI